METATTLLRDLQTADSKAKYDAAVKRILADKMILAWIMKSCIAEFRDIDIRTIADQCIEGNPQISEVPVMPDETNRPPKISGTGVEDVTMTEGTITFDIRFGAVIPGSGEPVSMIINVEGQNDFYPGYPLVKRGIYYCSRMISSQYGTVFTKSHYEKIRKVCSIWVCSRPPKGRKNTITTYSIMEQNYVGAVHEPLENYDLMTAVIINLGEPESDGCDGILKLLSVLLSTKIDITDKRRVMEQEFDIPMTEQMKGQVLGMCNLSEGIWNEAIETKQIQSIKSLMKTMKWTIEQAMNALEVPENEQKKYKELVEQQ